jgi:hypothetical protein
MDYHKVQSIIVDHRYCIFIYLIIIIILSEMHVVISFSVTTYSDNSSQREGRRDRPTSCKGGCDNFRVDGLLLAF